MLNTTISNNQSFKTNAVCGSLFKSLPKSFFKRFHLNSQYAENILCSNPYYKVEGTRIAAVILQIMVCGDMEVIAEIIDEKDYEEILNMGSGYEI